MEQSQPTTEGQKKRSWFRRHKILTGLGILFILGFIGALIPDEDIGTAPQKVRDESSSNTETTQQTFIVGDTIQTEKFEITITDVTERSSVGSDFFESTPAEGGVYITVQWKYKNISDEPISSWSDPRLKLIDPNNAEYSEEVGASGDFATEIDPSRKVISDLNPGISVNDSSVFEVSKERYGNGKGWKLLVKADQDMTVEIEQENTIK